MPGKNNKTKNKKEKENLRQILRRALDDSLRENKKTLELLALH